MLQKEIKRKQKELFSNFNILRNKKVIEKFAGKWIAICNSKIIKNSKNSETVLKFLKGKGIDNSKVALFRVPRKNEILIL